MNLIIDIGNSRLKYGYFDQHMLIAEGVGSNSLFEFMDLTKTNDYVLFISASGTVKEEFTNRLMQYEKQITWINREMIWPIRIDYKTPHTLGYDRIANCVGAMELLPDCSEILVIDIGSAITYNYIVDSNKFIGGNISLGVGMRFKALHYFTANLPLLEPQKEYASIGQSTNEAIIAGVLEGITFEIEGVIDSFIHKYPCGKILFTGGGYSTLFANLHIVHRYERNIGLIGLNKIYNFNEFHKL